MGKRRADAVAGRSCTGAVPDGGGAALRHQPAMGFAGKAGSSMRFSTDGRPYLGSLSCERSLMSCWASLEPGRPLTLMVPPLRPAAMDWFEAALSALRPWPGLEFSLNDLGALALCSERQPSVPCAAGPLLAGQDTDPRILGFLSGDGQESRTVCDLDGEPALLTYAQPPDRLALHWATPSALDRMDALARIGASRVEICAQPAPLAERDDLPLPVALFQGLSILSVLPCGDCEACAKWRGQSTGAYGGQAICRHRNLLFWRREMARVPGYIDRVVRMELEE